MYNDSIQRATSPAASACESGVLPSRLRCLSPVTLRLRPIAAGRAKCCLAGLTGGGCQCRCLKGGHNRHAGFVWCFGERGTARPIHLHVPLSPWAWVVPRIHECLIEFRACGCYLRHPFFLFSLSLSLLSLTWTLDIQSTQTAPALTRSDTPKEANLALRLYVIRLYLAERISAVLRLGEMESQMEGLP